MDGSGTTQRTGPLQLIVNRGSGSGDAERLVALARKLATTAGRVLTPHLVRSPRRLEATLRQAVSRAGSEGGTVVVAGGDGTIRSAAQLLAGGDVPLALIPAGTFNFFARNHAIPSDVESALQVALAGHCRAVDLGEVNGHCFLINASYGLYSRLIRAREDDTRRWGRHQLVALFATLRALVSSHPLHRLSMTLDDEPRELVTPMVFVGSNALQLRNVELEVARCVERHRLAVVVMRPVSRGDTLRLALRGLMRRLEQEQSLDTFCADRLTIEPRRAVVEVVLDGELLRLQTPLRFCVRRAALPLIVPATPES